MKKIVKTCSIHPPARPQPAAVGWRRLATAHLRLLGCVALMLGASCSAPSTPPANTGPQTLRVGLEADFTGFDPLRSRVMGVSTLTAASAMFDTLISLNDDGDMQPRLAHSLSMAADGLSWTARLRKDVTFHDGSPFDAHAVAYHFARLLDPANGCACRAYLKPLKAVNATTDYTVDFKLRAPWAALPAILGEPSVISLIGSPTALSIDAAAYHRSPVGTGPYRFERWHGGEALQVVRYADYYAENGPHFERITFSIRPDQQTRFTSLRAGDLDIIWTLHAASAKKAKALEGIEVLAHTGAGARLLVLNTQRPPLDDLRVRRALAHAANMPLYTQAASEGLAQPPSNPFGPGSAFGCPDTATHPFATHDLAQAKSLLQDYGRPVTLNFAHTPTPRGQAAGQILQQFWQTAGIEVALSPMEQVELVQRVVSGDYQIGPWRLRDSLDPDADLYALLHSSSPLNVTGLRDPALDALLDRGRSESSRAARQVAYCELSAYLAREVPFLLLASNTYYLIAHKRVAGLRPPRGGILDVRTLSTGAVPDAEYQ